MKKNLITFTLLICLYSSANAQGTTIETLINNLFASGQIFTVSRLIEGCAYLGGIAMSIKGILKLSEWNESKGRNVKLSTPLVYLLCSGLLMGLPTMLAVGSSVIYGEAATTEFNSQSGQYGGKY